MRRFSKSVQLTAILMIGVAFASVVISRVHATVRVADWSGWYNVNGSDRRLDYRYKNSDDDGVCNIEVKGTKGKSWKLYITTHDKGSTKLYKDHVSVKIGSDGTDTTSGFGAYLDNIEVDN